MLFERNPRLRVISYLGGGVVLVFLLLGAQQWWNTSRIGFLNPDTAGETLAFMAFTVLLFLLLIALLMLLLRTVICGLARGTHFAYARGPDARVQLLFHEPHHGPLVLAEYDAVAR